MRIQLKKVIFILCLAILGCGKKIPPPPNMVTLNTAVHNLWATVLERHVDDHGRVDFGQLAKNPDDLESVVAAIATHESFTEVSSFGDRNEQIAESLNSYNALAMYNVIRVNPESLESFFKRTKFFYFTKFTIAGESMSLYAFEKNLNRALADPRIHFALNWMTRGCPRLPRIPFRSELIQSQLDIETIKFLSEDRNVNIDAANEVVWFSELLRFYQKDFIAHSGSLIAYVNSYRVAKIPEHYKVKFSAFDWQMSYRP